MTALQCFEDAGIKTSLTQLLKMSPIELSWTMGGQVKIDDLLGAHLSCRPAKLLAQLFKAAFGKTFLDSPKSGKGEQRGVIWIILMLTIDTM